MNPSRRVRSLLVAATATALPFLLSGCLVAALLLPPGQGPANLAGNYRDESTSVELCGATFAALAYLTVVRDQYGDYPASYGFSIDVVIQNVDPGWDGVLRNFARATSWSHLEASNHDGVAYGSPYEGGFGRVDLGVVEGGGLTGSALLLNVPHACGDTRVTATATVPLAFGEP